MVLLCIGSITAGMAQSMQAMHNGTMTMMPVAYGHHDREAALIGVGLSTAGVSLAASIQALKGCRSVIVRSMRNVLPVNQAEVAGDIDITLNQTMCYTSIALGTGFLSIISLTNATRTLV